MGYRLVLVKSPARKKEYRDFVSLIRNRDWVLSAAAYRKQPQGISDGVDLARNDRAYLLKSETGIVGSLVTRHYPDQDVIEFRDAEMDIAYQRGGLFARSLGERVLRETCHGSSSTLTLTTWPFNRKAIPLFKRAGFRGTPGTSLVMLNFIPMILRHYVAKCYFSRNDFIRTLESERSYGYDDHDLNGLSVFNYVWSTSVERLRVDVDWQRREIVRVEHSHVGK